MAMMARVAGLHGPMLNLDFRNGMSPENEEWFWSILGGAAPWRCASGCGCAAGLGGLRAARSGQLIRRGDAAHGRIAQAIAQLREVKAAR